MPRGKPTQYSKEDCIDCLSEVADKIGKSPTHSEWRDVRKDMSLPSYSVIVRKFGSWNEAKSAANLKSNPQHSPILDKPDNVDIPDKKWKGDEYSGGKRSRIRRVALLAQEKLERGCYRCGYDEKESALEFHHPDGRDGVSLGKKRTDLEKILKEAKECKVICGNCHNIIHREKDYIVD